MWTWAVEKAGQIPWNKTQLIKRPWPSLQHLENATIADFLYNFSCYTPKASDNHRGTSKEFPANECLIRDLDQTRLSIFVPIADLGYFAWNPSGSYKDLAHVTATEITEKIDKDRVPTPVVSIDALNKKLPEEFATLPPQKYRNKFPYSPPYISALHVAVQYRGLDTETVDFYFGGSTLEMLANATIPKGSRYLVCVIPTTKILLVYKYKEYVSNFSDPGYQFERFVLGRSFEDKHDKQTFEHLQLMLVGDYNVLFSANVDGADADGGDPVEIKSSSPRYWGTKTMFQMLSSGSLSLIAGFKRKGSMMSVRKMHLSDVIDEALSGTYAGVLEEKLKVHMEALKEEVNAGTFDEGKVFEISFDHQGKINLDPCDYLKTDRIFTPEDVVEDLLI